MKNYMRILFVALTVFSLNRLVAQNPIIRNQFSADPSARVFNGKVYLYPSHDIPAPKEFARKDWFCMQDYHVFSSSNLTDWTDHGVIVSQNKVNWVDSTSFSMWAPDCIVNPRSGWYGDFKTEEGSGFITGQIRTEEIYEKEMTMSSVWGYTPMHDDPSKVISAKGIIRMLVDCTIRNMALLLNVAPDRHGKISKTETDVLLETGKWLQQTGEAIYGTYGGPWQPKDGLYGYAYKNNTIYLFLLEDYKATTFTLPPINKGQKLVYAYMVDTKEQIKAKQNNNHEITLSGIYKPANQISIIAIELNKQVMGQ
jgi:hypothetical protein